MPTQRIEMIEGYAVIFDPSADGGWTVTVPTLPGCISEGDTLDAARANIRDAIALWREPLDSPPPN